MLDGVPSATFKWVVPSILSVCSGCVTTCDATSLGWCFSILMLDEFSNATSEDFVPSILSVCSGCVTTCDATSSCWCFSLVRKVVPLL